MLSGSGISTNRFVPSVLTSRRIQFVRCHQSQNQAVDRELQTLRAEHHHPNIDVFAASASRKVTTSDHAQRKSVLKHKLFFYAVYTTTYISLCYSHVHMHIHIHYYGNYGNFYNFVLCLWLLHYDGSVSTHLYKVQRKLTRSSCQCHFLNEVHLDKFYSPLRRLGQVAERNTTTYMSTALQHLQAGRTRQVVIPKETLVLHEHS